MSALASALAEATTSGTTDNLDHVYCCNPDAALCGTDISGHEFASFDVADCVVCADLEAVGAPCSPTCVYGGEQ